MKTPFLPFVSALCLAFSAVSAPAAGDGEAAVPADAAAEARAEVFAFLKDCPAFFLATVDAAGEGAPVPRVRPFGALALWDGALYIQTGNFKAVYRQMTANPRVELCALKPDRADGWIRIEATAVPDTRREALSAVLDANPALRGMYDEDDGKTAVFRLENATATISSFRAPPRTLSF
ncbi:MAG: pyridoxamine 5'-phosphate oxidase family protein [Kiritimatiellae bacterium]|nr:pyridoxamine 5'-phosphate oxidase family protein [Kiritimatiellia bacterium]